jgi:hypothetical protein
MKCHQLGSSTAYDGNKQALKDFKDKNNLFA